MKKPVIPWIVFSIIEWRKYDVYHIHHMMAIVYSIFLAFLTLGGLEEYITLRSWGKTPIEIGFAVIDGVAYIGLLIACSYLGYRSAMQATRNIRVATKIFVAILLLLIGIPLIRAAIYGEIHSKYWLAATSLLLAMGIYNAWSAYLDLAKKEDMKIVDVAHISLHAQ
ncbi:MAG: hypothetical protein J7K49_04745 [Thaumarchaeota archaeon]|nr:hypothetical protein [Nitrososphaerota archaeon]